MRDSGCEASEQPLHKNISAGVFRWMRRPGQMAKADLLVEVNGGLGFGVRFQIETMRPHEACHVDSELQQFAAGATAASGFRNGHLGKLEFAGRNHKERTAADRLAVRLRDTNLTAAIEDVGLRIADQLAIGRLEFKEFADPFFVQAEEGGFVAGAESAADNAVRTRLG